MSIVDQRGVQRTPTAESADESDFWRTISTDYVGTDRRRAKRFCVLALRAVHDIPVDVIARAFGIDKGHVSRMAQQAAVELRDHLRAADGK